MDRKYCRRLSMAIQKLEQKSQQLDYGAIAVLSARQLWRPAVACVEKLLGRFTIQPRFLRGEASLAPIIFEIENGKIIWLGLSPEDPIVGILAKDQGAEKALVPYLMFGILVHEIAHLKQAEAVVKQYAAAKSVSLNSFHDFLKFMGRGRLLLERFIELNDRLRVQDHLWKEGLAFWVDGYVCDNVAKLSQNDKFIQGKDLHHSPLTHAWDTERRRLSRVYYEKLQRAVKKEKPTQGEKELIRDFLRAATFSSNPPAEEVWLRLFDRTTWSDIKSRFNYGMLFLHAEDLGLTNEKLGNLFREHWMKTYGFGAELTQKLYLAGGLDEVIKALNAAPEDYEEYVTARLTPQEEELDLAKARGLAERFKDYQIQL